jgi:hypothetical protein
MDSNQPAAWERPRAQRAHELLLGPEEVNFGTHFRQESGPLYVEATREIREMNVIIDLIGSLQEVIQEGEKRFSPDVFNRLAGKVCHKLIVGAIKQAVRRLPDVMPSNSEKELGKNPKWRPDVRLLGSDEEILGVVEYESVNSSDERVISKDAYGYEGWAVTLERPVPFLIITSLPDSADPNYCLRWTGCNRAEAWSDYNLEHKGKVEEIRQNPFLYWYAHYRRWLEHRIAGLPVHFANFSGNELSPVTSWPTSATPYQPALDDGADWSGIVETPDKIQEVRKAFKKKLWAETNLDRLKDLLTEYWAREQALWGANRWNYEPGFERWRNRLRNRDEACRWIEKVQWARLY